MTIWKMRMLNRFFCIDFILLMEKFVLKIKIFSIILKFLIFLICIKYLKLVEVLVVVVAVTMGVHSPPQGGANDMT